MTLKKHYSEIRGILLLILAIFLWTGAASGQQTCISGTVNDVSGNPIIGATVLEKGTVNGTITDLEGNFSLNVNGGNSSVISVSFIGYQTLEFPAGESKPVITLEEDTKNIDEVVVIGYGQIRKGDATGSLTTVKTDEGLQGVAVNAQDVLSGKVAGVTVTNAGGNPTGGSTIRIRGGSSLSASNDPLILIDGVPLDNEGIVGMGNMLGSVNPSDIESFTVLKDASATAIYGSRASNGVIIITTKKGTSDKLNITYDGNVSVSMRKNEIDVLDGNEYRDYVKQAFASLTNYDEVVSKLGTSNTDWQSEIFRTSISTDHNISVTGNVRKTMPFRVSAGYSDNNGILKTSNMERYTGNVSLSPVLFDKSLKINVNLRGMYIKNRFADMSAIGSAVSMDPTQSVYDSESKYGGYWSWVGSDGNLLGVATKNPVAILEMKNDNSKVKNLIGNINLDYALPFLKNLRFNVSTGIDYSRSDGGNYTDPLSPVVYNDGGYTDDWSQNRQNTVFDAYLKYDRQLDFLKSKFDVTAGYTHQHYWREGESASFRITKYDEQGNPLKVDASSYETENYLISYFGRFNYEIMNKYLFTATVRRDGSSRFSKDNRWGLFPSLAAAWKITNESFIPQNNVLSDLKLRFGYGNTGQQDILQGDYPYIGTYVAATGTQANYYRNGEWISVIRPSAYNEDLKWETTSTYNFGLDYGFFDGRINGAIDVYYRKTCDLINAETKSASGTNFAEYVISNIGSLKDRGVEFSVSAAIINKTNFKWDVDANIAFNKSKIINLTANGDPTAMRRYGSTGGSGSFQLFAHSVGHSAGMYYVYKQIYDSDGNPIEGLYDDLNDDGSIDENDLYLYKKAAPDYTFGFSTKVEWRGWDLSITSHGSVGNYNYNSIAARNCELDPGKIYANEFLNNIEQSAFETNFLTKKVLSDYYVQDASFFRIDNIMLGRSFKTVFNKDFPCRIYTCVQNPVVFTKYDGLDPEIDGGVDSDFYPRPLTVILGINIKF